MTDHAFEAWDQAGSLDDNYKFSRLPRKQQLELCWQAATQAQAEEVGLLRGENAVLMGLLTDCAAVVRVVEADDTSESDALAELLRAIDHALSPSRHKGDLL